MRHFTMSELTYSRTAQILHISNIPSDESKANLVALVDNVLDKARDAWGKPIKVNSGYRCPELNKAVGGVRNSQHLTGEAADISTGTKEGNKWLFNYIKENCVYDQLINEQGYSWVHVSYNRNGANRGDVLHR